MSESHESDRQPGTRLLPAIVFCVLTYFLSAGPAIWLFENGYVTPPRGVLQAFYAPAAFLVTRSELLTEFAEWYLRLWGGP